LSLIVLQSFRVRYILHCNSLFLMSFKVTVSTVEVGERQNDYEWQAGTCGGKEAAIDSLKVLSPEGLQG
jgi:hypothetical protein